MLFYPRHHWVYCNVLSSNNSFIFCFESRPKVKKTPPRSLSLQNPWLWPTDWRRTRHLRHPRSQMARVACQSVATAIWRSRPKASRPTRSTVAAGPNSATSARTTSCSRTGRSISPWDSTTVRALSRNNVLIDYIQFSFVLLHLQSWLKSLVAWSSKTRSPHPGRSQGRSSTLTRPLLAWQMVDTTLSHSTRTSEGWVFNYICPKKT